MAHLDILDVGHGSCAVLTDNDGHIVIDAGTRQILVQYLISHGIETIDAVLISHSDLDHLGGIIDVLLGTNITIRKIFVNPDAMRHTKSWTAFRIAVREAVESGRTELHPQLSAVSSQYLTRRDISIQVIAPSAVSALAGIGGHDINGSKMTAHSMSAVIQISTSKGAEILLTGDMSSDALRQLRTKYETMHTRVLVFPHHGGLPGDTEVVEFVSGLCELVQPELVVFSTGRDRHQNPRPEIVQAVKQTLPGTYIICTQLSRQCAADLPLQVPTHLSASVSHGMSGNKCCAGTFEIELGSEQLKCNPSLEAHASFVLSSAPTALCLQSIC